MTDFKIQVLPKAITQTLLIATAASTVKEKKKKVSKADKQICSD